MESEEVRLGALERAERNKKFTVVAIMSPLFLFLGIKLLAPLGLFQVQSMHFSPTDWELVRAGLIERADGAVLLLKMDNEPPGFDIAYERLVALDPVDGAMLGQVVESRASWLVGLTDEEVWVLTDRGEHDPVAGYALPDLKLRYDMDDLFGDDPTLAGMIKSIQVDGMQGDLRVQALDGHAYRLTPSRRTAERLPLDAPPPAPTLLRSWRSCDMAYDGPLIDFRGCTPLSVAGEALTLNSIESNGTTYFVISRRAQDGTMRWEVSDQDLFGDRGPDDPFRAIRYLTLHEGRILLAAEDGRGVDDIYAAAIDTETGQIAWTRTFW